MLKKFNKNVIKKLTTSKSRKITTFYMYDFFKQHKGCWNSELKKFKKTETANIIVNFQDGKKLITDLESEWKLGPEWAQQHLWHDSMTKSV